MSKGKKEKKTKSPMEKTNKEIIMANNYHTTKDGKKAKKRSLV